LLLLLLLLHHINAKATAILCSLLYGMPLASNVVSIGRDGAVHGEHWCVNSLAPRLDCHAEAGDEVNLLKLFSFMTLDVMGEIAFGNSFGLLEETNYKIIDWMQNMMLMIMLGIYKTALGDSAAQLMLPREVESEKKGSRSYATPSAAGARMV
jgi:hypothetical protein